MYGIIFWLVGFKVLSLHNGFCDTICDEMLPGDLYITGGWRFHKESWRAASENLTRIDLIDVTETECAYACVEQSNINCTHFESDGIDCRLIDSLNVTSSNLNNSDIFHLYSRCIFTDLPLVDFPISNEYGMAGAPYDTFNTSVENCLDECRRSTIPAFCRAFRFENGTCECIEKTNATLMAVAIFGFRPGICKQSCLHGNLNTFLCFCDCYHGWYGKRCNLKDICFSSLGMEDGRIDMISGPIQNANLARFNSSLTEPIVWVPISYNLDVDVWIKMTLPSLSEVTAIAVHGGSEGGDDRRVIRYYLKYQYHDIISLYLDDNGNTMYFPGNFQPNFVRYNLLPNSIICDKMTFTGTHWQNEFPGLKIELYGCPATDIVENTTAMLSTSQDQRSTAMPSFTETTVIQPTTEHNATAIDPTTAPSTVNQPTTEHSAATSDTTTATTTVHQPPTEHSAAASDPATAATTVHQPTTEPIAAASDPTTAPTIVNQPTTEYIAAASDPATAATTVHQPTTEPIAAASDPTTVPTIVNQPTTEYSATASDPATAATTVHQPTTEPIAAARDPTTAPTIVNQPTTEYSAAASDRTTTPTTVHQPITEHSAAVSDPTTAPTVNQPTEHSTAVSDSTTTATLNHLITMHRVGSAIEPITAPTTIKIPPTVDSTSVDVINSSIAQEITHTVNNANTNEAEITTRSVTQAEQLTENCGFSRTNSTVGDITEGHLFSDLPRSSESNNLTSAIFTTSSVNNNLIRNHIENTLHCKNVTCVNTYVSSVHQVMNMSINTYTFDDELLFAYFDFIETVLNTNLTNKDILSDVLHELDTILNPSNVQLRQSIDKNNDVTSKLLSTVESLVIEYVLKSPEEAEINTTKEFNVRWVDLESEGEEDILTFTRNDEQVVGTMSASNVVGKYDYLLVIVYESLHLIRPVEERVGTHVTSLNLFSRYGNVTTELPLSDELFLQLKITLSGDLRSPNCSFWDLKESYWSDDGCVVWSYNDSWVTCLCDHLTSFAVLMQVSEFDIGEDHDDALRIITLIGVSISIICLVLTLIAYTLLRLLHLRNIAIHANLTLSLLLAHVLFITGIDATENETSCKVIAIFLHYFFLSSFAWMMIEGAYLYVKASQAHRKQLKIIHYAVIGWGSPIIIVGITLLARYGGYGSGVACWLGLNDGVIWAFVAPVLIVGMINTLIMVSVIRTFSALKANADKARAERMKSNLRAILLLQPLLGVTWLFGVLSFNFSSWAISFQYLFVICNSLQGAFIFILHCVMNEEVKKAAQRYVHKLRSSHSGIRGKGKVHSTSHERNAATTAVTDSTDAWN